MIVDIRSTCLRRTLVLLLAPVEIVVAVARGCASGISEGWHDAMCDMRAGWHGR